MPLDSADSNSKLLANVSDFLHVPLAGDHNCPSQLQLLMDKYDMDVAQLVNVIAKSNADIAKKFMHRSQDYNGGKESLLRSPALGDIIMHGTCLDITSVI